MTTSSSNLTESSLLGIQRGVLVQGVIFPFEVIKNRLQCTTPTCHSIISQIWQKEGLGAFYKGFQYQLLKTCFKQAYTWPVITGLPDVLENWRVPVVPQQVLTALTIATIESLMTPLEKSKVRSAVNGTTQSYFKVSPKEFTAYWKKLAVHWVIFLVAQKIFRDLHRENPEQPLTGPKIVQVGLEIALPGSLCTVYIDTKNTRTQVGLYTYPKSILLHSYRALLPYTLILTAHCVATVYFLEKLKK